MTASSPPPPRDPRHPYPRPPGPDATSADGTVTAPRPLTPPSAVRLLRRVERADSLDRTASRVDVVARTVAGPGIAGDVLTGAWLGHALHPLLTDFPLGTWMSASLLDLFGGPSARPAARRLTGFGVAAAVPTVASGLAEFLRADRPARRVGVVHAAVNTTALALYASSYACRRRGHHRSAVTLGVVGGVTATVGGYFGGHLSLARKAGTRDPRLAQAADVPR